MIHSILVTNYLGESVELELRFPEKSGFLVESVDGLGPGKANINTTEYATKDGSLYNSARVNTRNIVFKLKLLPMLTVEDTRQKSYKYFPIKKRIDIRITSDNRICDTYGYVETNEIDIFSKEVATQISVICPDPYLYDSLKNSALFGAIEPSFEFPFSNESLVSKLIFLSEINYTSTITIDYRGEVENGMVIYIYMAGPATNIVLYNNHTLETMTINTDWFNNLSPAGLIEGDEIIISTVRGSKYVRFLRDGVYYNILNCLDIESDWLQLTQGENTIGYTASSGVLNIGLKIDYHTLYEGV